MKYISSHKIVLGVFAGAVLILVLLLGRFWLMASPECDLPYVGKENIVSLIVKATASREEVSGIAQQFGGTIVAQMPLSAEEDVYLIEFPGRDREATEVIVARIGSIKNSITVSAERITPICPPDPL